MQITTAERSDVDPAASCDELQLAVNGQYSTLEAVGRDVHEALTRYSSCSNPVETIREAGPAP